MVFFPAQCAQHIQCVLHGDLGVNPALGIGLASRRSIFNRSASISSGFYIEVESAVVDDSLSLGVTMEVRVMH